MPVTRTIVYNFEEGAPLGSVFIPSLPASYGGVEEVYAHHPASTPVYSSIAASGNHSVTFPENPDGIDCYYSWYAPSEAGMVRGIEATFKIAPGPTNELDTEVSLYVGDLGGSTPRGVELRLGFDESGIWSHSVRGGNPDISPIDTPHIPVNMSQWLTAKILPTGEWSLAYHGGSTILSGNGVTPTPYGGHNGRITSFLEIHGYSVGVSSPAISQMWMDNIVFWVYSEDEPPPSETIYGVMKIKVQGSEEDGLPDKWRRVGKRR